MSEVPVPCLYTGQFSKPVEPCYRTAGSIGEDSPTYAYEFKLQGLLLSRISLPIKIHLLILCHHLILHSNLSL
ncbi:hypothetical protein Tco_1556555 [Tanacetum coccineum]